MISLLLHLLRLFPFLCGGHRHLALENLALRHQLVVYRRTVTRPKLRRTDRLVWVWLARVWDASRQPLLIVTSDTVLRWQRRRFRKHRPMPRGGRCRAGGGGATVWVRAAKPKQAMRGQGDDEKVSLAFPTFPR
jgi:hypothetical protein